MLVSYHIHLWDISVNQDWSLFVTQKPVQLLRTGESNRLLTSMLESIKHHIRNQHLVSHCLPHCLDVCQGVWYRWDLITRCLPWGLYEYMWQCRERQVDMNECVYRHPWVAIEWLSRYSNVNTCWTAHSWQRTLFFLQHFEYILVTR